MLALGLLVAMVALPARGDGAAGSVTTSVVVGTALVLDTDACLSGTAGSTALGPATNGGPVIGSGFCEVEFGASGSSMLKLTQVDHAGVAMTGEVTGTMDSTYGNTAMPGIFVGTTFGVRGLGSDVEPDGTLVQAGNSGGQPGVYRHTANGASLDNTFDGDGHLQVPWNGGFSSGVATDIGVTNSGDYYLVGHLNGTFQIGVRRVNRNGTPEATFHAADGTRLLAPASYQEAQDLHVYPDERLLVAGSARGTGVGDENFFVARLMPNGTNDPNFAGGAFRTVDFTGTTNDVAQAVDVAPDGRIVVAGAVEGPAYKIGILQLTEGGTVDLTAFGGDGKLVHDMGGVVTVDDVIAHPDGKVTVVGSVATPDVNFLVARFDPDGTTDNTFGGGDGIYTLHLGTADTARSVLEEATGRMLVAGDYNNGTEKDGVVFAVSPTGALDTSFNSPLGYKVIDGVADDELHSIVHQGSGGVFVTGTTWNGGQPYLLTAKLRAEGVADYAEGVTDWDDGTTGAFGACLRELVGANALEGWDEDANNDCTTAAAEPWNGIARTTSQAAAKVAASSSGLSTVRIQFGMRSGTTSRPGTYRAHVRFETMSPDVP